MAKPKGATSFEKLTLSQLRDRLKGNEEIPIRVSKKWLSAVDELFAGDTEADADTDETETDVEQAPETEKKSGVKITED